MLITFNKIIDFRLVLILCMFPFAAFAQTIAPMNMKFEQGSPGEYPPYWRLSEKNIAARYILRNSKDSRSGNMSLEINTDSIKQSGIIDGTAFQSISPLAFLGRTVRFSVWAKAKYINVPGSSFIWIKVYRKNKDIVSYPLKDAPEIKSDEWKEYDVTAKIPNDAVEIQFGVLLNAEGSLWLDDAEFQIVGGNTPYSSLKLTPEKISDLLAFSKLFFAFAYYYPDSATGNVDLNSFAEYGVSKLTDSGDKRKLTDKLKEIFSHLGTKLEFGKAGFKPDFPKISRTFTSADTIYPQFRLYEGPRSPMESELTKNSLQNITQMHRLSPGFLSQIVKIPDLTGSRAHFSVKIKTESTNPVANGFAAIAILDTTFNILQTVVAEKSGGAAADGFSVYSADFKIPRGAASLDADVVLEGDGRAVFDDASLEIDGKEYLENGGFEQNFAEWRFDRRAELAGYENVINTQETISGKKSAEIRIIDKKYISYPKQNDVYSIEISDGLFAYFPKVLLNNDKDNSINPGEFRQGERDYSAFGNPEARIAAVIAAAGNMDNFSLVKCENYRAKLDTVLSRAMLDAEAAETTDGLASAISEISILYPDNALRFWNLKQYDEERKPLPFTFDWADGEIVVSRSLNEEIPTGSVLESINGLPAADYLNSECKKFPCSNDQLRIMKSLSSLKYDSPDSGSVLGFSLPGGEQKTINAKKVDNGNELNIQTYAKIHETEKNVWYVDLQRVDEKELMVFLKNNAKTLRGLILDMRGFSSFTEYFFKYFKKGSFRNVEWAVPFFSHYRSDASENPEAYSVMPQEITGNGNLENVKLLAICDETTIGINESNLELLRRNEMAESVGTATAGAPTEITVLSLPCSMLMSLSAATAMDSRGNMLAGKPFTPDYIVDDTRKSIENGEDIRIKEATEIIHGLLK